MCANSKGPGETARMRRLTWAFAGRLCDKSHNLMSWLSFIELQLCFQRIPFSDHINTSIKDQTFLYLQQCKILRFLCEDNDSWYKNALTPRATDKTLNLYFICTKTPCIFQIYKAQLCWARHAVPKDICILNYFSIRCIRSFNMVHESCREKTRLCQTRPTKVQISMRIRTVWSAPLLFHCLDSISLVSIFAIAWL